MIEQGHTPTEVCNLLSSTSSHWYSNQAEDQKGKKRRTVINLHKSHHAKQSTGFGSANRKGLSMVGVLKYHTKNGTFLDVRNDTDVNVGLCALPTLLAFHT